MLSALVALVLASAPSEMNSDERAIRQVVTNFRRGIEGGQPRELLALFWPGAEVFEHGDVTRSPEVFVRQRLVPRFEQLNFKWIQEENSGRAEGTLAYVGHRARIELTPKGGEPVPSDHTLTFVLRKRDGVWKIAHLHWSTLPGR